MTPEMSDILNSMSDKGHPKYREMKARIEQGRLFRAHKGC